MSNSIQFIQFRYNCTRVYIFNWKRVDRSNYLDHAITSQFLYVQVTDLHRKNYKGFCSSLSFQFRHLTRLLNQSSVWSDLFMVGRGCWLMQMRTESPRESCCLLLPSKETHALLRASSGTCDITHVSNATLRQSLCIYN